MSIAARVVPCRNSTAARDCEDNGPWGARGNDSSTSGGTREAAILSLGRQVIAQQITGDPMRHLNKEQPSQRADDHHTENTDRLSRVTSLRDQKRAQAFRGARVLDDDRADEREPGRGAHS